MKYVHKKINNLSKFIITKFYQCSPYCYTKDGDPSHIPDCSTIKDMLTPSANDDVEYGKSYRDIDPNVVAQRWTHTKLIWNLKPSMH